MNRIILGLILMLLMLLSRQVVFCQNSNKIDESELIQIFEKYLTISNPTDYFYSSEYAVKIIKEEDNVSYSVVMTSICYADELPKDSLIYINIHDIGIFIISANGIDMSKTLLEDCNVVTDNDEINRIARSKLHVGGVMYYPFIIIFKVSKESFFLNTKNVRFETFMPSIIVPKKYWPIAKPIGAVVDELPRDKAFDIYGNLKEEWKTKFENGRGKFKIKTPLPSATARILSRG